MWTTVTNAIANAGCVLDLNDLNTWNDGSISVMLKFISWMIFLTHFALYWCNTGVVSAIGVHFTGCLQRVWNCSLFLVQWAMEMKTMESWLICHVRVTFLLGLDITVCLYVSLEYSMCNEPCLCFHLCTLSLAACEYTFMHKIMLHAGSWSHRAALINVFLKYFLVRSCSS